MKLSHHQNILLKERTSHRLKQDVTHERFSTKQYLEKTPLKRDVNNVSFKGVLSLYNVKKFNIGKNIELLEQYVGKAPSKLQKLMQSENWVDIQKNFVTAENGLTKVKTKNWTSLLMEGVVYPIAKLPLHIAENIKKSITGKGFKFAGKVENGVDTRSFLQKQIQTLNNDDIVNTFSGYLESAEKLKYDSSKVKSANLFTRAMKMFDQKSGNYNGVHERALTRIVTGFIPAFFLANDAYNLSRICDDDPIAADKERKTRFNQETKRVLSNAYLQLITLGALSKYINSNKWVFMAVTAITVVATESFSRLSNGKKINFINKEQAIELNQKEAEKKAQNKQNQPEVTNTEKAEETKNTKKEEMKDKSLSFKGSPVFNNFGFAANIPILNVAEKPDPNAALIQEVNNSKPLLTLPTIAKWFATVIVAGFALKYAKKNIKIQGQELGKYFNVIGQKYDNLYKKITTKNYKVTKSEFEKIVKKFKDYDEVLGQKFEEVAHKYQKTTKLSKEANNIAKVLEEAGLNDLAQQFKHLANKGNTASFKGIAENGAANKFFSGRNSKIIEKNIQEFLELLESNGHTKDAEEISKILFENGKFSTKNYTKAKKYIEKNKENKALKEFLTTFDNRFKVDNDAENLEMFKKAMNELRTKNVDKANELEKLIEDAVNASEYTFGNRRRPGAKEFVDFFSQPVKFIWGTITLPFKHIANPIYNMFNREYKLPQWEKEIDAVYNGINRITTKPFFKQKPIDLPTEKFAEYMDLKINKAFNSATMSSISNSDLSALAKNTSTAATAWFLMADNHNMVMQKSNGEDKTGANLKAKERAIQETSRTFWNVLFINLFNDTFRSTYNSSLLGAQAVNTASTVIGEYVNRTAIGMPVSRKSKNEILTKEYENITDSGIKGKVARFMSRLTGKKVLSQRNTATKK